MFGEPLLYFFYGRPAYRTHDVKGAVSLNCSSLTCFVVQPDSLPKPKRIFPFDSGAMSRGFYEKHIHRRMKPSHFEIAADLSEAMKLVGHFYGSNTAYFMGAARAGIRFPVLDMEAQCFHSLISEKGASATDDRRGSVEVSYDCEVPLNRDTVLAVILPADFWDDPEISRIVKGELGAEPLSYDTFHAAPTEDTRAIMTVAKDFLTKEGYLA